MDSRTIFLKQVAAAVRSGNRFREATRRDLPANFGHCPTGQSSDARLADELRKVGAHVQIADGIEALDVAVRGLVDRFRVRRAILNAGPVIEAADLDRMLREMNVTATRPADLASLDEESRLDLLFAAELGIAAPDWAIAETGTLVYAAGPDQSRSASLLPPVHLAIVDRSRILDDLMDLPAHLVGCAMGGVIPRNVALVTGPSKTGDIELRLTTGVHGPGEVHVIIWSPTPERPLERKS